MAKSKNGGTRAMIRGRVGSDVYSVGRDAAGKKQQVVRSLAETVTNRRTESQMRGRMIMSTVMQALSALKPIVDHSFDNVSGVQANLSEFISRNYGLVKADVAAHPSSGNAFGLVMYQANAACQGAYVISDGKAAFPALINFVQGTGIMTITLPSDDITVGALKSAWEVGKDGYLTIVGITQAGAGAYARLHLDYTVADATAITADNVADLFQISGVSAPVISIASNVISIALDSIAGCGSVIVTRKVSGGFIHSKATLGAAVGLPNTADVALASYPKGTEMFLNGGGDSQGSSSVTPSPTPTPDDPNPDTPVTPHLSSFSVGGANLLTGGHTANLNGEVAITGALADKDSTKAYAIVMRKDTPFAQGATSTDGALAITGTSVNGNVTVAASEHWYFALTEDTKVIQVLGNLTIGSNDEND